MDEESGIDGLYVGKLNLTSTSSFAQLPLADLQLPEPIFKSRNVFHGRISCQICFEYCGKNNLKRKKYEKITDMEQFKNYAIRWEACNHEYRNVYKSVDWTESKERWAHKACKGKFLKEKYLLTQQPLPETLHEDEPSHENVLEPERPVSTPAHVRSSSRKQYKYRSSLIEDEKKKCIICNEDKYAKGRLIPCITITVDKAEKTLREFSEIHIKNDNHKYKDGATRILLTLTTSTLFAADVSYHRTLCYHPFRSPAWKRGQTSNPNISSSKTEDENPYEDIFQLVKIHIIGMKEIYTLAQLKSAMDKVRSQKGLSDVRSTDLRENLQKNFGDALTFHRRTLQGTSEFVCSTTNGITDDCIMSSLLGGGIPKSISLRSSARTIHESVKSTRVQRPWPPTPQDILNSDSDVNTDLYNELAWIVDPDGKLDDDGKVQIKAKTKVTKLLQIAQDLQALIPKSQPSLDQVLLSLTMHRKTGSSGVVETLHRLGHGISYTDTVFIEDKWAEWGQRQHSDIPSNIVKGVQTTHIADNIDWKNKEITGMNETHNTNSILVQPIIKGINDYNAMESRVSLKADYNFRKIDHRCFKAKSIELPQCSVKKSHPLLIDFEGDKGRDQFEKSTKENLAWVLSRRGVAAQTVPGWSAFRQLTTEHFPSRVRVGYLPAITASPTKMNVILSIINKTMQYMTELELDYIFLEADQAIYNKVLQVLFKFKQEGSGLYDKIIVRMGGFHIIICLMRAINSRFAGSGIVELLAEAGVGAEGTIKAALNAGNVKQGIRYYKLLFESLLRTKLAYLESKNVNPKPLTSAESSDVFFDDQNKDSDEEPANSLDHCNGEAGSSVKAAICSLRSQQTPQLLDTVVNHTGIVIPPQLPGGMACYMDSLIEMIDLLLNTIHFQRVGNWEGFLEAIDEFLPWCFGLNRQNYARNMSYFYVDMRDLKLRNPNAYQFLMDGGFSGSLTGDKHTKIPMDLIIEMTLNRFCKEQGGLSGKTENADASERWMRIDHYMAALKQHLQEKVKKMTARRHVELGAKRMHEDEAAVERITAGLTLWVPNLWSANQPLVHLSTGIIAPAEMIRNVTTTKARGEIARNEFFKRITKESVGSDISSEVGITSNKPNANQPVKNYTDPIRKQDVYTFEKLTKQKREISIIEDEGKSYAAILADYDQKKLDLRAIMDWPITSKPWAICNEHGVSRASLKSLFRNNLQLLSPIPPTTTVPTTIECCIVDAMRVVRIITITELHPATFMSWAIRVVSYLKCLPGSTVHVVFDDYDTQPGQHHLCKGRPGKGRDRNISDLSQLLPKPSEWNDFLSSSSNKLQVTQLLTDFILSGKSDLKKDVYVTSGNGCYYLQADRVGPSKEVPALFSSHREADQRLAFHAVYAASRHRGTCVVADDTDVFILLNYVASKCPGQLYFKQGTAYSKEGILYHDVKALAEVLGPEVCKALPPFHVLTGSDYTQPFFGRSKFTSFKKMMANPESVELLSTLVSTNADIDKVTQFILHIIYNRPKKEKKPGDSRYAMLFAGKGTKRKFNQSKRLPPDSKSLSWHIKRANFVSYGMANCLDGGFVHLNPLEYGWKLVDKSIVPIWYEGAALPNEEEQMRLQSVSADRSGMSTDVFRTADELPEELNGFQFVESDSESESDDDTGDFSGSETYDTDE